MATDKQMRRTIVQLCSNAGSIFAGVSSDVGHQHLGIFTTPPEFFSEHFTDVPTVAVSVYGSERTERR